MEEGCHTVSTMLAKRGLLNYPWDFDEAYPDENIEDEH
jgi:hypothetical protein